MMEGARCRARAEDLPLPRFADPAEGLTLVRGYLVYSADTSENAAPAYSATLCTCLFFRCFDSRFLCCLRCDPPPPWA